MEWSETIRRFMPRLAVNAAYRAVFDSPEGEKVLKDLMIRGGLLETSTIPGDPHMTHFRDGRRSLVLDILAELQWSESQIARLAREQSPGNLPQPEEEAA